jgi:hypothetical protein
VPDGPRLIHPKEQQRFLALQDEFPAKLVGLKVRRFLLRSSMQRLLAVVFGGKGLQYVSPLAVLESLCQRLKLEPVPRVHTWGYQIDRWYPWFEPIFKARSLSTVSWMLQAVCPPT